MKIRSLKQVLHWMFLVVGAVSVLMLALSIITYLDYAEAGYGLEADVADIWVSGPNLYMRIEVDNPGKMELRLGGSISVMTDQAGIETAQGVMGAVNLKPDNTTYVVISIEISQAFLEEIIRNGQVDIIMDLAVQVSERDMQTTLDAEFRDLEVRIL